MTAPTKSNLIHLGKIRIKGKETILVLKEIGELQYCWFDYSNEKPLEIVAPSPSDAIRQARQLWADRGFRTVNCGFRYTLPERDEHGMNALFCEMAASQNSPNGVYFDDQRGYNCFVQNASREAIAFWKRIK